MNSEIVIQAEKLTKKYGSFTAVENLSFTVFRGDIYGFLGPNGAGKSTTIRMLLSLITPSSGEIRMLRKTIREDRSFILSKIGSIVEKPDFYRYLSAYKNLRFFASISGATVNDSFIFELLELVGLKGREHDKVKGYSHGMKQRLGIAQTLLHDPDLIILDEPTTGLDPQGIIDIRNLIRYLQKEKGKTIVLSSHILSEIELISNRMIIINKGQSIIEGDVGKLLNSTELIVFFAIENPDRLRTVIELSDWKNKIVNVHDTQIEFHLDKNEIGMLNKYLVENGVVVNGIESKRKLEDYFLKLTGN